MKWQGRELVYRLVVGVVLVLLKVMNWRVRIFGADHVPRSGPFVVASNHVGYLDFVMVGLATRQRGRLVRFMAKQSVFDHPVSGPLMRAMKHIPVDRYGGRAADALDESHRRLRLGQVVGMFPEGTISPSFLPRRGKLGAARLAVEADVPLVPVAVWGSQRILTKWRPRNFQRGVAIDVHVGPPVDYERGEDAGAVTARLMAAIEALVAAAIEHYPQQPADADDRWWLPAHLGGTAPTLDEAEQRLAVQRRKEGATGDAA